MALPAGELWATALYAGQRRGELRALRWRDVDFDHGVIPVERGWDDEGEIEVKPDANRRLVPIVGNFRRLLAQHKVQTGRDGDDLVFGRTARDLFVPSTVRPPGTQGVGGGGVGAAVAARRAP